ncbi:MAG: recombination protein RecR [Deltaproteobacteria bacterium]|nr:MAG: recombination protein RecR [Deltaproteobacteria bacterium]
MPDGRDPITELINQLTRLPGIGERTAARLAFHVLDGPPDLAEALASALRAVRERVVRCGTCGHLTEEDPCRFCSSPRRDRSRICVVESTPDLLAVEQTGEYDGLYHVLHGLIRPLEGRTPRDLNLAGLMVRLQAGGIEEVILATNPSVEGEATALYVASLLRGTGVSVSRIASGLPMGGELEYADRATLGRALSARRRLEGDP